MLEELYTYMLENIDYINSRDINRIFIFYFWINSTEYVCGDISISLYFSEDEKLRENVRKQTG